MPWLAPEDDEGQKIVGAVREDRRPERSGELQRDRHDNSEDEDRDRQLDVDHAERQPARDVNRHEQQRCDERRLPERQTLGEFLQHETAIWNLLDETNQERRAEDAVPGHTFERQVRYAKSRDRTEQI